MRGAFPLAPGRRSLRLPVATPLQAFCSHCLLSLLCRRTSPGRPGTCSACWKGVQLYGFGKGPRMIRRRRQSNHRQLPEMWKRAARRRAILQRGSWIIIASIFVLRLVLLFVAITIMSSTIAIMMTVFAFAIIQLLLLDRASTCEPSRQGTLIMLCNCQQSFACP